MGTKFLDYDGRIKDNKAEAKACKEEADKYRKEGDEKKAKDWDKCAEIAKDKADKLQQAKRVK